MSLFDRYQQLCDADFIEGYDLMNCATVRDAEGPILELDVAVALFRCDGNLSKVAAVLKRSRRAVGLYIERNLDLVDLVEDIRDTFVDGVEERAREVAMAGDGAMIKFILGTLGKNRGYVSRVEATGKDGKDLNVMFFLPENGREVTEATSD